MHLLTEETCPFTEFETLCSSWTPVTINAIGIIAAQPIATAFESRHVT